MVVAVVTLGADLVLRLIERVITPKGLKLSEHDDLPRKRRSSTNLIRRNKPA